MNTQITVTSKCLTVALTKIGAIKSQIKMKCQWARNFLFRKRPKKKTYANAYANKFSKN